MLKKQKKGMLSCISSFFSHSTFFAQEKKKKKRTRHFMWKCV